MTKTAILVDGGFYRKNIDGMESMTDADPHEARKAQKTTGE